MECIGIKLDTKICRCNNGEDGIIGNLAASITPGQEVDEMLIAIVPRKQPRQMISMPPPTVEKEENVLVASFVKSARVKSKCVACIATIWRLPGWKAVAAASEFVPDLTVSRVEYRGLLLCFD